MTREKLKSAQKEMRQRQTQGVSGLKPPASVVCVIPLQWRFTVTLALRALIRSCHASNNEQGCQVSLQCARELGLDVETVKQYTHLEKKEDGNAK